MNEIETISPEDLKTIIDSKGKATATAQGAQRAALEAKNAELEHQVIVQHFFLQYGLSMRDSIDDRTGKITRFKPPEDPAPLAAAAASVISEGGE